MCPEELTGFCMLQASSWSFLEILHQHENTKMPCFFSLQLLRHRGWQHTVAIMLPRSVVYLTSLLSARILILFFWVLFCSYINFSSCMLQTWSLTVVILSKKYKQLPHMITTNLLVAQVSSKENVGV